MNDISIDPPTIENFAKAAFLLWEALEPWSSPNESRYTVDPRAFGIAAEATVDMEWEFYPLTEEEFTSHTGLELPAHAKPGDVWTSDTGAIDFGLASSQIVSGLAEAITFGIVDGDPRVNWYKYFQARGPVHANFVENNAVMDAPWAEPLSERWADQTLYRLQEIDEIRAEMEYLILGFNGLLEEVSGTDLSNSVDIERVSEEEGI